MTVQVNKITVENVTNGMCSAIGGQATGEVK